MTKDQIKAKYYYVPKIGYSNAVDIYRKLIEDGYNNITFKQVKTWYEKQSLSQVYKQPVKEYHHITCPFGTVGCLQIDLMQINKFSKQNKGFNYLLNITVDHQQAN